MANLFILYGIMFILSILTCIVYKYLGFWRVYEMHYLNDFNTADIERDSEQQAYMNRLTEHLTRISFNRGVISFALGAVFSFVVILILNQFLSFGISVYKSEFKTFRTILIIAAVAKLIISVWIPWIYRDGNRVVAVLNETRRRAAFNPHEWSNLSKYIRKMYRVQELGYIAWFNLGFLLFVKLFANVL